MDDINQEDLLRKVCAYQNALTSYAYGLLHDWSLAEDAVQEAFIAVHKTGASFKPGMGAYPWARRIVHNKAVDIIRSQCPEKLMEHEELLSLVDHAFAEHLSEEAVEVMERQKHALQKCMDQMKDDSLYLLLGFYRDRSSCGELAAARNKSVNSIRLILSRLRNGLRQCVKQQLNIAEGMS